MQASITHNPRIPQQPLVARKQPLTTTLPNKLPQDIFVKEDKDRTPLNLIPRPASAGSILEKGSLIDDGSPKKEPVQYKDYDGDGTISPGEARRSETEHKLEQLAKSLKENKGKSFDDKLDGAVKQWREKQKARAEYTRKTGLC